VTSGEQDRSFRPAQTAQISTDVDSQTWSQWDPGTGANVAQEPKPGRIVRHSSQSRNGTDLPDFHK